MIAFESEAAPDFLILLPLSSNYKVSRFVSYFNAFDSWIDPN